MRWGVETSFRDLKYIIGMLKFHSRKSSFVTQEIYAALIMHNMTVVVSLCVEIPQKERKYEYLSLIHIWQPPHPQKVSSPRQSL